MTFEPNEDQMFQINRILNYWTSYGFPYDVDEMADEAEMYKIHFGGECYPAANNPVSSGFLNNVGEYFIEHDQPEYAVRVFLLSMWLAPVGNYDEPWCIGSAIRRIEEAVEGLYVAKHPNRDYLKQYVTNCLCIVLIGAIDSAVLDDVNAAAVVLSVVINIAKLHQEIDEVEDAESFRRVVTFGDEYLTSVLVDWEAPRVDFMYAELHKFLGRDYMAFQDYKRELQL